MKPLSRQTGRPVSRRSLIRSAVAGSMLMPAILSELLASDGAGASEFDPLAPKPAPHFHKAKHVIFLYMSGGVSHVDTFDPKPRLFSDHGKEIKLDHPETRNRPGYEKLFLKQPQWKFTPRGRCGTELSELFPHLGGVADDLCVIRSMHGDHSNHYNATLGMHTGSFNIARPSIGSWVSYGLGSPNRNLPSFIVIAPHTPYAGTQVWASDFLPGSHQGTRVVPGAEPMPDIRPRVSRSRQQKELDALAALNRRHLSAHAGDADLAARIRSFETAFGMQMAAPEAFDLSGESDETLSMYGLKRGSTNGFAWQCITARRLVERGVRFVELIDTGSSGNWDSHANMLDHAGLARNVDQPMAALIRDLKLRGLLDETLVTWATEFGRTPFNNKPDAAGREHHAWAFSAWMAGGGVRGGMAQGETDEHGIRVARDGVHVHDFHATILYLLGIDHTKLTYRHAGRDYRLTDVAGEVVHDVVA
jgi:Protein of unknown function (DUF1501)